MCVGEVAKGKGGRKPGSLNKKTLAALALTEGLTPLLQREIPKVIDALIFQAKGGDVPAARLLLEQFTLKAKEHAALVEGHNPTGVATGGKGALNISIQVVGSDTAKDVDGEVIDG